MAQLWGGRFRKPLDPDAVTLSYSLHVDQRLFLYDLKTNLAYAKALQKVGLLEAEEVTKLSTLFTDLGKRFEQGDTSLFQNDEDVHSAVERLATEALGDTGKKIHTGKSRNDQVITDVRLYVKDHLQQGINSVQALLHCLVSLAQEHKQTVFPGLTHFQPAQPVLLAHHLLAYAEQFLRDKTRLQDTLKRMDYCPLGSGALAGNSVGIDREFLAKELGFAGITRNSMDTVSDRDFIIESCSALAMCMSHMSRLCEELVLWSSPLLGFASIGDEFTTGSSLMPQKKNPDMAELIRGKSGRVIGNLMGIHHVIKALPLTYNRDLQEDKEYLFDSFDTVLLSLTVLTKMLKTVTFNQKAIETALSKGYVLATDFAEYLVHKGVPFREAHDLVGQVVSYAVDQNKTLEQLTLAEFQQHSFKVEADVVNIFDFKRAIQEKNSLGGTAFEQVNTQIKWFLEELKNEQ